MRDEDKPFIYYQHGRWSFRIAPRNARGVRASILWVMALAPIVALFIWAMNTAPNSRIMGFYTAIYVAAMLAWSIAMLRWMKARSEIVNFEELMQIKRERDAVNKRRDR
jgi:hypothetical protein